VNVAGEVNGLAAKTAPVNADELFINDSAASWAVKKVTVGSLKQGYALIEDQKTSGTGGGGYNSLVDQTRTLNTTVADTIGISLSSNQITLPAGTYHLRASAPSQNTNAHQILLYNVTDAALVKLGQQAYTASNIPTFSFLTAYFTITSSKAFEIRHRCQSTNASSAALGLAGSLGTEVYTSVEIIKE